MPEEIRVEKTTITNYPSNSHKERETPTTPPKKVEKVVTGEVVTRKRPLGRRIVETFAGEDVHSVGGYILFEVALPALKTMISDMASQGVERLLFGEVRRSSSIHRGPGYSNYTSYNRMHASSRERERREEPRPMSHRARASHDFGEIVLASRVEADDVLDRLSELIERYDVATVSDLYELVGITGSFTDDKWGWTDLRGSEIRRVRDGFLLMLPRTMPID